MIITKAVENYVKRLFLFTSYGYPADDDLKRLALQLSPDEMDAISAALYNMQLKREQDESNKH